MGLSTGQMQEETQQLLDEYNELYNWEYNDMCEVHRKLWRDRVSNLL